MGGPLLPILIPWLQWVPYAVGAVVGYGYGLTGWGLLPVAAVAALYALWRAVR